MEKARTVVTSPVGEARLDCEGSAIGAARMNPDLSYSDVPKLLKEVINRESEEAWAQIKTRIDYTYACLTHALDALEGEASFCQEVRTRVEKGQKLLFKPNLVGPVNIDRNTHGPGAGTAICTAWPFVAAVMRWFHDSLDISYHQMTIGEAGSAVSATAAAFTRALRGKGVLTSEAVMEGRSGGFYGGWGFYFVRKYLAENHDHSHTDDPMSGYEESISGTYLPPGRAIDKLMVYDLNRIADDRSNGRDVPVTHGVNFQTITLHKAIVGGDPNDLQDREDYPGCVLINVPKLKVHDSALLTNAIKNLGIGLYPMEVNISDEPGKVRWKYALPHKPSPGLKSGIPHHIWVAEIDEDTLMPRRGEDGQYLLTRTGGMPATMADIIEAVKDQDIFMLHVVDAIETTSRSNGPVNAKKVPEGYVFASTDPVALDVLCARYLFTTLPMVEARRKQKEANLPTDFLQKVPLPRSDGCNIVTEEGYDSPVTRYPALRYCQERGLGQEDYYVVGRDEWQGGSLASLEGHLGRVVVDIFSELLASEMYFSVSQLLWDLQGTTLAYAEANDTLTGSNYRRVFFDAFDQNGDGVIDYDETGKTAWHSFSLSVGGHNAHLPAADIGRPKFLQANFLIGAAQLQCTNKEWNSHGHDFGKEYDINSAMMVAMEMSQSATENTDLFFPNMTWGKGKWPSIQFAQHVRVCNRLYGSKFPEQFDVASLYGLAFRYADTKWGDGKYTIMQADSGRSGPMLQYHTAVAGGAAPLPFVLYVPPGYGEADTTDIPNIEETSDPAKVFTVDFDNGHEAWSDLSLLSSL